MISDYDFNLGNIIHGKLYIFKSNVYIFYIEIGLYKHNSKYYMSSYILFVVFDLYVNKRNYFKRY